MILARTLLLIAALLAPQFARAADPAPGVTVRFGPEIAASRAAPGASLRPAARTPDLADRVLARLPRTLRGAGDLTCLAMAIYHEARGEPLGGQYAVAAVITQRMRVAHRWGASACEVVVPVQFSFLGEELDFAPVDDIGAWAVATRIALRTLEARPDPRLRGADHYHADYVAPGWAEEMVRVGRIGTHIFYRDPASFLGG